MTFLQSTYYFDYESESIQKIIAEFDRATLTDKEKAVAVYERVRDGWMYNPYHISLSEEKLRASYIAEKPTGHCIEKSVVLIAVLRGLNIPARLHLGKVRNHIAVGRLMETIGTDELTPH